MLQHVLFMHTGNTVIHLDKALSRIKEYERMKFDVENNQITGGCTNAIDCADGNLEKNL